MDITTDRELVPYSLIERHCIVLRVMCDKISEPVTYITKYIVHKKCVQDFREISRKY